MKKNTKNVDKNMSFITLVCTKYLMCQRFCFWLGLAHNVFSQKHI